LPARRHPRQGARAAAGGHRPDQGADHPALARACPPEGAADRAERSNQVERARGTGSAWRQEETAMTDVKLSPEELAVLRSVLGAIVVKTRTGEVGVTHGMDRFVSSMVILRRRERDALDSALKKLGLGNGARHFEG